MPHDMLKAPLLLLSMALAACPHGQTAQQKPTLAAATTPTTADSAAPSGESAAPFATPPVLPGTPDIAALAARVRPAVVNITVTEEASTDEAPSFQLPFDFFFGPNTPFGGRMPRDHVLPAHALGSGFIIDDGGHVITNAHVVAHAKTVKVKLLDEREFTAKVRARDPDLDVAVLDVEGAKNLPSVALGSSDALRVGEYVVAVGNPFGLGDTVTMGIVSAKSRAIGAGPYDDFIQTDAAINPGNSGGPLLNLRGQVVGINTAINPNGQGIGFAIPIDDIKRILPQLMSTGHVSRGRLGVTIQPMDAPTAKALGLNEPRGALVADVAQDGPAAKAGLKAGDVIESVDQASVRDSRELPRIVSAHAPGSKVSVKVMRQGHEQSFDVTLDTLNNESTDKSGPSREGPGNASPSLGVRLADTPNGATVVAVTPGSASEGQLESGDIILQVNQRPVRTAADVARQVQQSPKGQPLLLKIRRQGQESFVGIERK